MSLEKQKTPLIAGFSEAQVNAGNATNIVNTDSIPNSLKEYPNWVNWKLEKCNGDSSGKSSKVPICAKTGKYAKTNDPNTWCSFTEALKHSEKVGFVITNTNFIGMDVDHPFDNEISQEIITHFNNTYCEKSPSGNLRIFCLGKIPRAGKADADKKIEVYDKTSPRYLTVTGRWISDSHSEIGDCQDAIDWLFKTYFKKPVNGDSSDFLNKQVGNPSYSQKTPSTPVLERSALSDDEILEKCRRAKNASKFEALFDGGGNDDESSGDLALAGIIAFYTKDYNQVDRLMRSSNRSNFKNGKWDKKHHADGSTYGQKTIEKAIQSSSKSYVENKRGRNATGKTDKVAKFEQAVSPKDWYSQLAISITRDGTANIKSNFYNLCVILENDKNLDGLFQFSEFTNKVDILKENVVGCSIGELNDHNVAQVKRYVQSSYQQFNSHFVNWNTEDLLTAIVNIAKTRYSYHPVRDYLKSLKWDGISRIDHFFSDNCESVYDEYTAFVAKSLFLSAVARVFAPGCKVDTMVILEGAQGIGKSSLFRTLVPQEDWFKDSVIDMGSKDAYTGLIGKWTIEWSELDALNKAESTRVKSFITSQVDSYRPPYGKCDINVPRQCIFAGTTNNKSGYFKDETGNRRFFPILCKSIDIENIIANRDQLWGEAVYRYQDGEKWYLEKSDISLSNRVKAEQDARYESDIWENKISSWLTSTCLKEFFTLEALVSKVFDLEIKDIQIQDTRRIRKILTRLGCEYKRSPRHFEDGTRPHGYSYNP